MIIMAANPKMWSVQAATAGVRPVFISPPALNVDDCAEANRCSMNTSTECGAEFFMERGVLVRDVA
jgi:hypothetical protein